MPKKMLVVTDAASEDLVARNPIEALLPPDRLAALAHMPDEKRNAFYGNVLGAMFSSAEYQRLVFDVASREFDRVNQQTASAREDIRGVVEEAVAAALKARGIH